MYYILIAILYFFSTFQVIVQHEREEDEDIFPFVCRCLSPNKFQKRDVVSSQYTIFQKGNWQITFLNKKVDFLQISTQLGALSKRDTVSTFFSPNEELKIIQIEHCDRGHIITTSQISPNYFRHRLDSRYLNPHLTNNKILNQLNLFRRRNLRHKVLLQVGCCPSNQIVQQIMLQSFIPWNVGDFNQAGKNCVSVCLWPV